MVQTPAADDSLGELLVGFLVARDAFTLAVFDVYIVIAAVTLELPAVPFEQFDKVFSLHRMSSLHLYYTPLMRICQAVF